MLTAHTMCGNGVGNGAFTNENKYKQGELKEILIIKRNGAETRIRYLYAKCNNRQLYGLLVGSCRDR
jgi:hypothetical protein